MGGPPPTLRFFQRQKCMSSPTRRQTPRFLKPRKHAHKGFFTQEEATRKRFRGKSEENVVSHTSNLPTCKTCGAAARCANGGGLLPTKEQNKSEKTQKQPLRSRKEAACLKLKKCSSSLQRPLRSREQLSISGPKRLLLRRRSKSRSVFWKPKTAQLRSKIAFVAVNLEGSDSSMLQI